MSCRATHPLSSPIRTPAAIFKGALIESLILPRLVTVIATRTMYKTRFMQPAAQIAPCFASVT